MTTEQAYAEVERLTRKRARNFAYGIMVLPREKRRAISAIYAFARCVDDVADGADLPPDQKREQLEQLRDGLASPGDDAMSVALADARSRFPIPDGALQALVDGGLQDLDQTRTQILRNCAATARRWQAPSASRVLPSTAPTTSSGPRRSGSHCS